MGTAINCDAQACRDDDDQPNRLERDIGRTGIATQISARGGTMRRGIIFAFVLLATLQQDVPATDATARRYYSEGIGYLESGPEYEEAVQSFKEASRLKPDFAEAFCKLAEAYRLADLYDRDPLNEVRVRKAFRRAIELKPDYAEA